MATTRSGPEEFDSWWTGEPSQLSLLEIAAAAGLPASVAPECGKAVCIEYGRRHGKSSKMMPKELRGEPFPSRVYPVADICWVRELLREHAQKRQQRLCKEAAVAEGSCSSAPDSEPRGTEPCTPLLTHRIGSANGPWSSCEALKLVEAIPPAQLDASDTHGCTAAHRLAKWGYSSALEALADRGANLDARTYSSGRTPLMAAILQYHVPIINLLLQLGTDLHARDTAGQTALDHAQKRVVDGRRRNCTLVKRFDSEAALYVLEGWCSRAKQCEDVRPESAAKSRMLYSTEIQPRELIYGVSAKAVIQRMRERDAEWKYMNRAKRRRTSSSQSYPHRKLESEPEPEPEPEQ